ncbi:MAG: hypothetical protein JRJ59_08900, partial [Deltaproteobacteria bacterium]|nr:hypothetical protein [Deltaproteobacteria bacterium]
ETGIAVDWEGAIQSLNREAEVIQPRLRLARHENMGQGPEGLGRGFIFHLSINIFVKSGSNAGRLAEIRDLLTEALPPGGRVPFLDFSPEPPQEVDEATILGLVLDQPLPPKAGYVQHNLTLAGHLVQDWSSSA